MTYVLNKKLHFKVAVNCKNTLLAKTLICYTSFFLFKKKARKGLNEVFEEEAATQSVQGTAKEV